MKMSATKVEKFSFSYAEDEKLLDALAPHPAIYDLKNLQYKDQRAKDNTWVIIANEVGRSGKQKKLLCCINLERKLYFY